MKKIFLLLPALCLVACAGGSGGGLTVFDVEKAIADRRPFDLTEIARDIEFIPLDDSRQEALLGRIGEIAGSGSAFLVSNRGATSPLAVFDPSGRFVGTRGSSGRGPDDFMGVHTIAADPATGNFYASATMGDMSGRTTAWDLSGAVLSSASIAAPARMAFHDGTLVMMRHSNESPLSNAPSPVGTSVPLLEIYSPGLAPVATVNTIDKGTGNIMFIDGNPADPSTIRGISVLSAGGMFCSDGSELLVKEARGDTLSRYVAGPEPSLEPVGVFDMGRHKVPDEAYVVNPTVSLTDRYSLNGLMATGRWWIMNAAPMWGGLGESNPRQRLIFDRRTGEGFSALGPDGEPGLFLDGVAFTPAYVHDGRLTGHLSALAIVDAAAAGTLTHPGLKTLAVTLREESNPVIAVLTLR